MLKKVREVLLRQKFIMSSQSWTPYRFFTFFFSWRGIKRVFQFGWKTIKYVVITVVGGRSLKDHLYHRWLKKKMPKSQELRAYTENLTRFEKKPLISLVTYDIGDEELLRKTMIAIQNQIYNNLEIFLLEVQTEVSEHLKAAFSKDLKINFVQSEDEVVALNKACTSISGEFVMFLRSADILTRDALYKFVEKINCLEKPGIIYSDEDCYFDKRFFNPNFKPIYAPDNLMTRNYFGRSILVNASLMQGTETFRGVLTEAPFHDLWLRLAEQGHDIGRVTEVLYHSFRDPHQEWNEENSAKAIESALERRGTPGKVERVTRDPAVYRIDYELPEEHLISVIIPTKDKAEILETCLSSMFEKTSYQNYEVIVVDNNSAEQDTFRLFDFWRSRQPERFRVLKQSYPFNFSKLMNSAVRESRGNYVLLLNNDVEIIQPDWMEEMLKYAVQKHIGAVGTKLLFPNDTVQHAGVIIGLSGIAGHAFAAFQRDDPGYRNYLRAVNDYSAVTAACLLVEKKKYLEVDGFDESLAVELNDVDFGLKLRTKGYYNVCVSHVELYHYESLSRGHPRLNRKSHQLQKKEWEIFKSRWQKEIDDDPFYSPNLNKENSRHEPAG